MTIVSKHFPLRETRTGRRAVLSAFLLWGIILAAAPGLARAVVVTYPAPAKAPLSGAYQIQANGQKVDVYKARVLDPPFAGKQWDYGGPYSFANFDMSGRVVVRIRSKRSLRDVIVRPESYGIKAWLVDDNTLEVTLDEPRKISIEPDGKKGP
ncbi:MAG: hypothetical protein ACYS8Z_24455, partial [Planctomycetota bacterium]